tara:strand:- start:1107 stop:1562 length:456 start_codon:yes stop_codon:yes gene_type:complete
VDQQSVKVKSAYLINFVRFINWPESKKEKVSLGFLGDNKLERYIIKTKSIAEKRARLKISVLHFDNPDSISNCDILYTENTKLLKKSPELVQYCADNNILIVTSRTIRFPINSCINFLIVNSKLRFEINNELLKRNKLKASAQLLKLSYKR